MATLALCLAGWRSTGAAGSSSVRVTLASAAITCASSPTAVDHRAIIVAGAQIRDHVPANIADLAVGQDAFEPVTHVDAVFVVVYRKQNKDAPVRALFAHLPLVFKLVGVVSRIVAVQDVTVTMANCELAWEWSSWAQRRSSRATVSGESTWA